MAFSMSDYNRQLSGWIEEHSIGSLIYQPSALDPTMSTSPYFVKCKKHGSVIHVAEAHLASEIDDIRRMAAETLKKCKGCILDLFLKNPKWPEGAEL